MFNSKSKMKMKNLMLTFLVVLTGLFVGGMTVAHKTANANDTATVLAVPDAYVSAFETITSAGTAETEIEILNLPSSPSRLFYITVDADNTGTIQFSVGQTIDAGFEAWPAGSKVPITVRNGLVNLRYKASAAGQSFVITY